MAMRVGIRRVKAYAYYLRTPLVHFLPTLLCAALFLVAGGLCFHRLYAERPLRFGEAVYLTYCLILMEHTYPYPEHWLLRVFYWGLPVVGFVVILDGIVRFSYYILQRDEGSKGWIQAMAKTMTNHVVLCGLGKLGIRVLEQLLKLGEDVVVLEKDPHCPHIAFARKNDIAVLIGHSREAGILEDLNIARAKAIILATNDDLANIEMALDARRIHPGIRVVLRMFDQELATKIRESFDIRLTFSTSALAAPLFATSALDQSIIDTFFVGDRLMVVAELQVQPESALAKQTVGGLRRDHGAFVLGLVRSDTKQFQPPDESVLEVGDRVYLQTEPAKLKELHFRNRDRVAG
jgi:Trk K+ transport system NAD-binding subunit